MAKAKDKGVGAGLKKVSQTALIRSMKELLKDYEIRAEKYETIVANSIRKQFRRALETDEIVTRFLVDPQDRRQVEYWDDDKLIKELQIQNEPDDSPRKRKREKLRQMVKEDKPLVKILPLIDAIRCRRYTHIQELFVWDCFVESDDTVALTGLITRSCYPITRIELIDCFLDDRNVGILALAVAASKSLKELNLDFNEFGEKGCRVLCSGLAKAKFLVHLSLSYCGLTKQCGLWLGNLVVETAIRELILDGNPLEAEGVIALLSQLSEAAESEGFERAEEIKRKQLAREEAKKAARPNLDLDPADFPDGVPPPVIPPGSPISLGSGKKKRRGKKGKNEPPPAGPQISVLKLADTGINHMGRGGNFAPVRCMQLLKSIISHARDLQEIDLFANEVGDLGARQVLEGLLARREAKLPQIGVRMGHRINQDTFDIIHKLAPGPKRKGKGKGKGKK